MPIAGVTGRADIMDSVHPGGLGGTYVGNPVSCAAAIVALDQVLDPAFQEQGRVVRRPAPGAARGRRRRACLAIGEVRGLGAMLAIELVEDRTSKKPSAAIARRTIEIARAQRPPADGRRRAVERGSACSWPLVATDADLDEGLEIFESALREASAA